MVKLFGRKEWPRIDLDEIKKRARVVVIDDADYPYLSLFEKDGYRMDKWTDVDDLSKLESGYYDIILLDIQGVGKQHSSAQGLGILKHLRQVSPAQIIMAYSSADWSLKYQEFFDLADARLAKSSDYVEFKREIDRLLKARFSLDFYLDRMERVSSGGGHAPPKLRETASRAILSGSISKLTEYLNKNVETKDVVNALVQIAQVAIAIYQACK